MGRALGAHIEKAPSTAIGVAKGMAIGALALVLTLDASVQEFVELIALSDDARRERFDLPSSCIPIISAVRAAAPSASRLVVFVDCTALTTGSSSPIESTSWNDK